MKTYRSCRERRGRWIRGFSLTTNGPPLTTFTFICEIAPAATGSTIAQRVVFSGPLASVFAPLMGEQMARHFAPVLDDLAAAAESGNDR
jgi:hypothetical protein